MRILFGGLFLLRFLWAQNVSSVHGIVTDPSAGLVPSASVTIANRTVRTDAQGRYQIDALAPGSYTVQVTAAGFSDFLRNVYEVGAGQRQSLNISLLLKTQTQQVIVSAAGASAIDTDPSANGGALVLNDQEMDALPDDPDDLSADLQALAGPAAGPNGGQFYIDGFTGGRMPPKASIREIRVNQNPFAAQFDKPGQGRIEIFTKPGSDDFHGEVLFQTSDSVLNSRNTFVAMKPPYQRRQWDGELGGPIRMKTSFFADFERRDVNGNSLVNAEVLDSSLNIVPLSVSVSIPQTDVESNLKLDRQLSKNHTLSLKYGFERYTNNNNGVGGFSLPGTGYYTDNIDNTFQAVETGILNSNTVNEVRFRFWQANTDQSGGVVAPIISVQDSFTSGGSPVGTSFDHEKHYELQNFTSVVKGLHTIRFGGLVRIATLSNQSMQNYSGTFTFDSLTAYRLTLQGMQQASQFTLAAGNPLASLSQYDYGVYVQDDWRLKPGITLSGGLRYENQNNAHDRADFAPRLGVAWALDRNKQVPKNILRAGFGIFYDRLSPSLTLDALRQNGVRQQQFLIQNPDFFPVVPAVATLMASAQPQTIRETDAHWRAPQLFQMATGYERQLPKHVTVATNYVHSIGVHQLRSRNINAPLPGSGIRPYGGINSIYLYEASGIYRQNQLVTNVNARVNTKLTLSGSYVYGRAFSNTDGPTAFPANQYGLSGEYGRAGFDIGHRVQFNGVIATRFGLRFSPFLTIASGRPYNITTGIDSNGDGLFTDRPCGCPAELGERPRVGGG